MKIQVISPWYPDYASPYSGVFVKKQVEALRHLADVSVEVPQIFPATEGPIPHFVWQAMERLGNRDPTAMYHTSDHVTYIPTPVPSNSGFSGRCHAFAESLVAKRRVLDSNADVTHAHLGVPTGWAAMTTSDGPLIVTEHQSTLERVFSEPEAKEAYRDVLKRADAFVCVSQALKSQIAAEFGEEAVQKVEIVPNVVDTTKIPLKSAQDPSLRAWIYVGTLAPHKGVETLIRAFIEFRRRVEPNATLTLLGDGTMRTWIERFTQGMNVVNLIGAVSHDEIGRYLSEADVMVHLSPSETFGIASLEAIAAGLPVLSTRNAGADGAWGDHESQCGLLIDADASPTDVVNRLIELRESFDRLDPIAGRNMVVERFSPEVISGSLFEIYERCLASM